MSGCKTIAIFAGNCPGQNRNQFVAYLLAFMNRRHGLDKLAVVLVEKGHTETENDSVRSVMERATTTTHPNNDILLSEVPGNPRLPTQCRRCL